MVLRCGLLIAAIALAGCNRSPRVDPSASSRAEDNGLAIAMLVEVKVVSGADGKPIRGASIVVEGPPAAPRPPVDCYSYNGGPVICPGVGHPPRRWERSDHSSQEGTAELSLVGAPAETRLRVSADGFEPYEGPVSKEFDVLVTLRVASPPAQVPATTENATDGG